MANVREMQRWETRVRLTQKAEKIHRCCWASGVDVFANKIAYITLRTLLRHPWSHDSPFPPSTMVSVQIFLAPVATMFE
jgi:hypothetical protein